MTYLRNAWYAASWEHELGASPLANVTARTVCAAGYRYSIQEVCPTGAIGNDTNFATPPSVSSVASMAGPLVVTVGAGRSWPAGSR